MFYKYEASEEDASPYGHQVYTAPSPDGLTWTPTLTLVRDHASVPGAVRIDDTIYLYFVDGEADSLGVGISTDEGSSFEFQSVTIPDTQEEGNHVDPNPVALESDAGV